MKRLLPVVFTALGLGLPAHAAELSASGSAELNPATTMGSMQIQNVAVQASLQAGMNTLKAQMNEVLACQKDQKFWNGSGGGCSNVTVATVQMLPTQTIPANQAGPWQLTGLEETGGGGGLFGMGKGCNYIAYVRQCTCTPGSTSTNVTINGTVVIIAPKVCDTHIQTANAPCDDPNNPGPYGPSSC